MIRWSDKALKLSRRRFLISGGAALAVPFLSSLPWRNAWADGPPRRFVAFVTPDGFERGTQLGFNSTSQGALAFARGSVLEPLTPFRNDLNLLENIKLHGQNGGETNVHWGMRQLLTGSVFSTLPGPPPGGFASLDQFLAKKLKSQTRYPSLEIGVASVRRSGADYGELSYQEGGVAVARETDPRGVFKRFFLSLYFDPGVAEKLYAEQRSVLDPTYDDLKTIMSQVSSEDRIKLEAHAEAYRDLEKSLAPVNSSCQPPTQPGDVTADYEKTGVLQLKLLAMALKCDLTRVATVQWSYPVSNMPAKFAGLTEDTHTLGHHIPQDWQAKLITVQRWYATRLAELLSQLTSAVEGDGTVLKNSVVIWSSELDDQPQAHRSSHMPVLMAGQAGGYFRTGRSVDAKGRYNNDLLISISRAMGIEPPQGKFGEPSLCTGEISALRV